MEQRKALSVFTKNAGSQPLWRGLLRNGGAQNLRPEEAPFGLLDDLLVDALWWVVHDDSPRLVVNLCVDLRISDQVDDPLFALDFREAKTFGEVPVLPVLAAVVTYTQG